MSEFFCPSCMVRAAKGDKKCGECGLLCPDSGWPADSHIGRKIKDKYLIQKRLGAGGFGQVFLARQVQGTIDLGEVVLKFLHKHLAVRESIRRRFINEARAARTVRSPHVVKVFDLDFDEEGVPFMVMEFIKGQNLNALLRQYHKLSPDRAFRIGLQVANALSECHEAQIIHRDLKPANLLLLEGQANDFVKVFDFGIARISSGEGTFTQNVFGTPKYMAPELIKQLSIDGRVDVFSMGVILYECLTGFPPIEAAGPSEYVKKNLDANPVPLRERCPEMPEELEKLLQEMMAKDPKHRPTSMANVEQRIRTIGVANGWVPEDTGRHNLALLQQKAEELQSAPKMGKSPDMAVEISTAPTMYFPKEKGSPSKEKNSPSIDTSSVPGAQTADVAKGLRHRKKGKIIGLVLALGVVIAVALIWFYREDRRQPKSDMQGKNEKAGVIKQNVSSKSGVSPPVLLDAQPVKHAQAKKIPAAIVDAGHERNKPLLKQTKTKKRSSTKNRGKVRKSRRSTRDDKYDKIPGGL